MKQKCPNLIHFNIKLCKNIKDKIRCTLPHSSDTRTERERFDWSNSFAKVHDRHQPVYATLKLLCIECCSETYILVLLLFRQRVVSRKKHSRLGTESYDLILWRSLLSDLWSFFLCVCLCLCKHLGIHLRQNCTRMIFVQICVARFPFLVNCC